MEQTKAIRQPKEAKLYQTLITFSILIVVMAVGIIVFKADPHVPIFIEVVAAVIMAVVLAAFGLTLANSEGKRLKPGFRKKFASEGA